ncbi:hypothetical protein J2Y54_000535 [Sphingomonas sp. BE123]|uniref:hypothetical protein n=1 Tax=Sphingomonas sp. BE123 TaxID=2817842 RepID=UPI002856AC1C|nr:hypothetical protein [Sphingomonas sp. BE123]MDR6851042.1 hypothetical protein [Sphingomonas sp. BE123]
MSTAPDYSSVAARAIARGIMVTPSAVAEIAELLGAADGHVVARYAANLVTQHAPHLGMDAVAARVLERAIVAVPDKIAAQRAEAAHG